MNFSNDITKILGNSQEIASSRGATSVEATDIFQSLLNFEDDLINQIFSHLNISKKELIAAINTNSPQNKNSSNSIYQLSYAPETKEFFDQAKKEAKNNDNLVHQAVVKNVEFQMQELSEKSNVLNKAVKNQQILFQGAVFQLQDGSVEWCPCK